MAFGDFTWVCQQTPFPLCPLVGPVSPITGSTGIDTICYARSVEIANTIIFEAATDFVHIVALIMTAIMIIHVRSKFTAVGRKEITPFFYIFMGLTVFSLILDAGVVTVGMGVFPYFVAVQNGFASALCTCLVLNGFVGFQIIEDGTSRSVWFIRGSSVLMFLICGMVSIFTFKSAAGLSPTNTVGLFVVLYILNALCLVVYVVMQIILVVNTLQDRWPLGDIGFGTFFFVAGQLVVYVFGEDICNGTSHYLDGTFFTTICNLLGVMMVYKYWDSITREDLEFSVGVKQNQWEVKEPLVSESDETRTTVYQDSSTEYTPDQYKRSSTYGGENRQSVYDAGQQRHSTYGAENRHSMYGDRRRSTRDPVYGGGY